MGVGNPRQAGEVGDQFIECLMGFRITCGFDFDRTAGVCQIKRQVGPSSLLGSSAGGRIGRNGSRNLAGRIQPTGSTHLVGEFRPQCSRFASLRHQRFAIRSPIPGIRDANAFQLLIDRRL